MEVRRRFLAEALDQSALTQILNYVDSDDLSALVETGNRLLFQKMMQCRLNIYVPNLYYDSGEHVHRDQRAYIRLGGAVVTYDDRSRGQLDLTIINLCTRLTSLSTATFSEFKLVGTPETLTDVNLTIMGSQNLNEFVLPDQVRHLFMNFFHNVENYYFLLGSKLTSLKVEFGWIPTHVVPYLPPRLTALKGIIVSDSTVDMLPPHITDLLVMYKKGDIDAFSKYPLISLHMAISDEVSLIHPENFPTLTSLQVGTELGYSGTLSLPTGLKHLFATQVNIVYNDVLLDYCVVSGDPAKIPTSAYCRAKVVDIDLTTGDYNSILAMLNAIHPDVERIELYTCTSDVVTNNAARRVDYDFSRFTKCRKLNICYAIRPTAYPPRLISLQDECDDFKKTYPRTLQSLTTDRRLSMKEILLSNLEHLTCVVGTDVLTHPGCFAHIRGRITFTTTMNPINVSALLLACPSGRETPIDVYTRNNDCLEW